MTQFQTKNRSPSRFFLEIDEILKLPKRDRFILFLFRAAIIAFHHQKLYIARKIVTVSQDLLVINETIEFIHPVVVACFSSLTSSTVYRPLMSLARILNQ